MAEMSLSAVSVVSPSHLKLLLSKTIPAGLPVLVTGAPGIGKSDIVAQAARAADADLILSHPAVADPTDAKGLPWAERGATTATFLPFGELAAAINAVKRTVWFLDDLGQAAPAVQASFMQLILARRVNGHKLPDCVTFVAATNRRVDRAGVSGILEPVKSRFATIVELQPTLDDWIEWAYANDVPPEMVAFLRFRPNLFNAFQPTADLANSPVPRTWSHVAKLLKLKLPSEVEHNAIAGAVGTGPASEWSSYMRTYAELPDIDAIMEKPETGTIPSTPAVLYAVTAALAHRANVRNFPRIAKYVTRLLESDRGEFAALLVRDITRSLPEVMTTPECVKLCCGPLGRMIMGAGR